MEKRILLAFLLSAAVMFGFRFMFPAPSPTAPPAVQTSAPPVAPPPPQREKPAKAPAPPASNTGESVHAGQAEDVQVDTTLYTATLTNHGGVLKSFKLKMYTDTAGKPIELIDATGGAKVGWPLAITTLDPKLDEILSSADFVVKRDGNHIAMEFASDGVRAQKNFTFDPENYEFSVAAGLTRDGKAFPHSIAWQGGFGDQSIPPDPTKLQVVYPSDTSFKTVQVSGLKEPQEMTVGKVGVQDQYFLAILMLPGNSATIKIRKLEFTGADGKAVATSQIAVPSTEQPLRVYIGPRDPKWLAKADPQLAGVIDYGFFGFIAKPLTWALLTIHSYIGNFGWSIIILTVLINLVLFPLRLKQQVSMQKMQKVQPQMKTLQDKYKKLKANDPKRAEVQSQMMNLYKEHGINPLGGCLPLLLQMPFLFAFWKMLSVSIELRQAPWMFWIKDLSQHDPYYIMPILMAVSMIITQKMTPTTVDPAQAKMMMLMPLMFTVMFLWSQSGLMLYWLTSNVVGIGQQVIINKYWPPAGDSKSKSIKKSERTE